MNRDNQAVLLFDGVCNLCSSAVVFGLKRDPKGFLLFASLQSDKGKELLEGCGLSTKSGLRPQPKRGLGKASSTRLTKKFVRLANFHEVLVKSLDSLVLIEKGKCYTRSTAALRVVRRLRGAWKLLYVLIIVPPFLRHPVYDFVARRRYRWFGKKDRCFIPAPGDRERFLD